MKDGSRAMGVLACLSVLILVGQALGWLLSLPLWAYVPVVGAVAVAVWNWPTISYFWTGRTTDPKRGEPMVRDHQTPIRPTRLYDWTVEDD